MLAAEDLMAGAGAAQTVVIPAELLPRAPGDTASGSGTPETEATVTLRPLTVRDLRLITRAARDNDDLTAALMVRQALVEPAMTAEQLAAMPAGLMQFLLREVNRISGLAATEEEVIAALEDPLVRLGVMLGREYGWTPEQVGALTMGEAMLHVAALRRGA
jgi:hypothetical protein